MTNMKVQAQGKTFTFPEGTTNSQIGEAVDDYFVNNQAQGEEDYFGSGVIEPAMTFASGLVAEPVAGLAGLGATGVKEIYNYFKDGGRPSIDTGVDVLNQTREAMTYMPKTKSGIANMQAIGETLEPVADVIQSVERGAGDIGYDLGGESPLGGAVGSTVPTAVATALGMKPFRDAVGVTKAISKVGDVASDIADTRKANKFITQLAPSEKMLKAESQKAFKAIDDAGVVINSAKTDTLTKSLNAKMRAEGFHPKLHPKVATTLDEFNATEGIDQPVTYLNTLRKFAESATSSIELPEQRLGGIMLRQIDEFMGKLEKPDFKNGSENIGEMYKDARSLWGRGAKSKTIREAMEKAEDQASGLENGIRIQLRQILNSNKKSKFFTNAEKAEMKKVVQGTNSANIARLIGKFGFGFDNASNMLGGSIGTGVGATLFGGTGAVVVPAVGSVSKVLAQHLTKNNAKFADAVVRAGSDGRKLVQEYIKNVPKADRNPQELAELLMRPNIALKSIKTRPNSYSNKKPVENQSLVRDALLMAELMAQSRSENSESSSEIP